MWIDSRRFDQMVAEGQERARWGVELKGDNELVSLASHAAHNSIVQVIIVLDVPQLRTQLVADGGEVGVVVRATLVPKRLDFVEHAAVIALAAGNQIRSEVFQGNFLALRRAVS